MKKHDHAADDDDRVADVDDNEHVYENVTLADLRRGFQLLTASNNRFEYENVFDPFGSRQ